MKIKYFLFSLSFFGTYFLHSMNPYITPIKSNETKIAFRSSNESILSLINKCTSHEQGKDEPFSVTHIFEKQKNNTLVFKHEVISIDDQDRQYISTGNAIYCALYTVAQTRLSNGAPQVIPVIITNTKNTKDFIRLFEMGNKDQLTIFRNIK